MIVRRLAILIASLALSSAANAAITPTASGMDVTVGAALTRVTALDGGAVVRVRTALGGTLPEDASWAVLHTARANTAAVTAIPNGFRTTSLQVTADPATGRLTIADAAGRVLVDDAAAPQASGGGFALAKAMPAGAHYFGLGDKTGPTDRLGQAFVLWNKDNPVGYAQDPIYKSVPFTMQVTPDGTATGLLVDDTFRTAWDFGKTTAGTLAIAADGGPIDYYVIAGPSAKAVLQHYTDITGPAPLPPLWALGFHQSRYSYQSTAEVAGLVAHFRADSIPLDAVWEDIDFQYGYRPFVIDDTKFANMAALTGAIGAQGVRLVAITDLHIAKVTGGGPYAGPYASGAAGDHFIKKADGSEYTGNVWPSNAGSTAAASVFPDFTRTATRAWWGGLYADYYSKGIAGAWNDMNEPAVFDGPGGTMPLDNQHRIDGDDFATRTATHAEIHNVLGLENARATYEGLLALRPTERPFVMTRATYAGGHRYGLTWTGDNASYFDQITLSVSMLTNLGLSGFGMAGADVGGFLVGPSANLLTRWTEVAAFQPFMRVHSNSGTRYSEPWTDGGAHEDIRRRFISERYRLLPYLYAAADEFARTGTPLNRPVWMEFPAALSDGCDYSREFLLGARMLIAVPNADGDTSAVCLPAGVWYDYWSGDQVVTPQSRSADIGTLPVYVAAGAMIPRSLIIQSTQQTPHSSLQLDVYPGAGCSGSLYLDDGHTIGGDYMRQALTCSGSGSNVSISFAPAAGSRQPWFADVEIVIHGWTAASAVARKAGAYVPSGAAGGRAVVRMPWSAAGGTIAVTAQ